MKPKHELLGLGPSLLMAAAVLLSITTSFSKAYGACMEGRGYTVK